MNRISINDLREKLDFLNEITKSDKYPYRFYNAYGCYGLIKVINDGGGARSIIDLTTKKDLFYRMSAYINGILNERDKNN